MNKSLFPNNVTAECMLTLYSSLNPPTTTTTTMRKLCVGKQTELNLCLFKDGGESSKSCLLQ